MQILVYFAGVILVLKRMNQILAIPLVVKEDQKSHVGWLLL
jgi:hypothetical protein